MLKFEQKLLIFPFTSAATALKQSLQRLICSNLNVEIIQDAETVKVRAKDLSCDPYWYNQFDILWVPNHSSTITSGKIFQLQVAFRDLSFGYCWSGQLIALFPSKKEADDIIESWQFSQFGGLCSVTVASSVLGITTALHRRSILLSDRWSTCLQNIEPIANFWTAISEADSLIGQRSYMSAIETLRTGLGYLVDNPENEYFFGHKRFRNLQQIQTRCIDRSVFEDAKFILECCRSEMSSYRTKPNGDG
jgi:hypothetical protein